MILQLSARNLWRQRRRNGILLVAVVVAVAGVLNMNAFMRGMLIDMLETAIENFTGHARVEHVAYRDDPSLKHGFTVSLAQLASMDNQLVEGIAQRIVIPGVMLSERETRGINILGINPQDETISSYSSLELVAGNWLEDGNDPELFVGMSLLEELQTEVGKKVVVIVVDQNERSREIGMRLKGSFNSVSQVMRESYAFTGLASLQAKLGTDRITEISVRVTEEQATDPYIASIEEFFPDQTVLSWREVDLFAAQIFGFVGFIVYINVGVIMGSLLFGLVNTFMTAVMERIREFGMLRAIGMQKIQVFKQIVAEAITMMCFGIVFGVGFGWLIYLTYADGIDFSTWAEGMDMFGVRPVFTPVIRSEDIVVLIVFSLVFGLIACLLPARKALKLTPLEAIGR